MTRQEALHELYDIFGYGFYNERVDEALNMAIKALEQQPKRGYWLEAKEEDPCWYRCSECGRLYDLDENYCPNCGARMEGNEE